MARAPRLCSLLLGSLLGCQTGVSERCEPHEVREAAGCVKKCEPGEFVDFGRCLPICDAESELVGEECLQLCAASEARDPESLECLPRCDTSEERIGGDCVPKCATTEHRIDGVCRAPSPIRLNSVGFVPAQKKLALTAAPGDSAFQVRDADERVVFEGPVQGPVLNADTEEELWTLDFSAFEDEGVYTLTRGERDESAPFAIADDVYVGALHSVMLGYYGLRCGTAVDFEHGGQHFVHAECHADDALSSFASDERVSAKGGWHDAGDYGKYVANAAFSVGMLLQAWEHFPASLEALQTPEIPEHGGPLPDYLGELRYELDWLLTMQRGDGAVHDKLTESDFGPFVAPERDRTLRALAPVSSEATADFAAVLAQAARVFEVYDADYALACSTAAKNAYAFLRDNPERLPFDAEAAGFHTGRYNSSDLDDRLWAAVQLWLSTGDAEYLADFESKALNEELPLEDAWDWTQVQNLAYFDYVTHEREGRDADVLDRVRSAVTHSADSLVETAAGHGYARAIGSRYIWGSNGILARAVLNLGAAFALDPNPKYREVALRQLDYLFGSNPFSRSLVTGVGFLPPYRPHHRPSAGDMIAEPWPGLLVGGPNPAPRDQPQSGALPALDWQDVQGNYWNNEVAINWNAPLVYALAWANTR